MAGVLDGELVHEMGRHLLWCETNMFVVSCIILKPFTSTVLIISELKSAMSPTTKSQKGHI